MNFRRVLDLLEFKTGYLNVLPAINSALVFEFHSHILHGTYNVAQGHTCDFSTNFSALEHVLVDQIWIMHIKCLENLVDA